MNIYPQITWDAWIITYLVQGTQGTFAIITAVNQSIKRLTLLFHFDTIASAQKTQDKIPPFVLPPSNHFSTIDTCSLDTPVMNMQE